MKHIKDEIKKKMDSIVIETELLASFEDWKAYKDVQKSGAHNMLSPMAVNMSGLEEAVYFDIIENYDEYEKLYGQGLFE
tara:strand:- start:191 stop:427 length:237 start_codon:yes stop_codon:yes gene_type:complete